jgi:putative DNA primase/helicase
MIAHNDDPTAYRVAEALAACERGWRLIPLNGKAPHSKNWPRSSGLHPKLAAMWARSDNLGVLTGSEIIVLDVDPRNGGDADSLALPPTPTVRTGGKTPGCHFYFRPPAGARIRKQSGTLGSGIDVLGIGAQCALVGSVHPDTGNQYVWIAGRSPDDIELAELPGEYVERLIKRKSDRSAHAAEIVAPAAYGEAALTNAIARLSAASPGQRNDTLTRVAFSLGKLTGPEVLSRPIVENALRRVFRTWGEDEKSEDTMLRQLDAGEAESRANVAPQRRVYLLTEGGNAERLRDSAGGDLRYCHDWGRWFVWDEKRFAPDREGKAALRVKEIGRSIIAEGSSIGDKDRREETVKWGLRSDSEAKRRATLALAASEPGVPVVPEQLDRDPLLLNVANGTLDMRTGGLKPHDRGDLITKLTNVVYNPEAECPRWLAFLEDVVLDAETRGFLQRAVFYSLTGDVSEHALFFLYGSGNNGKSTFLRVLLALGGEYAKQVADELLLAKSSESHPTEKADLCGLRVAVTSELPHGRSFNEALVKRLTGGDRVSARKMRQDFSDFAPTHHLWVGGNHKPNIRGRDRGIWRRVRLIPFTVDVLKPDSRLLDKLLAELPGILAWAVQGGTEYRRRGLDTPAAIIDATEEYRSETDELAPFLEERCDRSTSGRTKTSDLYAAYVSYCDQGKERPITRSAFGRALTDRGICAQKSSGIIFRLGVTLRAPGTLRDREPGSL